MRRVDWAVRGVGVAPLLAGVLGTGIGLEARHLADRDQEDFAKSARIIAETLEFLGDEALARRFLEDIRQGRVKVGKLDKAENAVTGTNNLLGLGANQMTLDEAVLVLGRSEIIWTKKKFDTSMNYLGWAETIVHEYVHMDQKDPKNLPKYEDPAYLHIARTHVRWLNRLEKILDMILAGEQDPARRAAKLRGMRAMLVQLNSLQGAFQNAVQDKLKDHTLNPHLPFANAGLEDRIRKVLDKVNAELKALGSQPPTDAPVPVGGPGPTGAGWHLDAAPKTEKTLPKADACYPSASLDLADGSAIGVRTWKDCSNASKCGGTYTGRVTWTPPPAFLAPGQEVTFETTAGTTAQNSCGYRNFSSAIWISFRGRSLAQAGESKYTGPPSASGKLSAPTGKPGDRMLIEVYVQAASLSGRTTYSYVYR